MTPRWQQHKPTVKEQRQAQRAEQLAHCRHGEHRLTPTFRAGEQTCTTCGVVFYCPDCLKAYQLPDPLAERAFPLACALHRTMEVPV